MENVTELLNTTLPVIVKNVTIKYSIRHHDRIDTFCDSGDVETEFLHFLICGLFQLIIHIFGIVLNICTILVLQKPDSHAPVYVFMLGLVMCDCFILIINGFSFILPQFCKYLGLLPTFTTIVAPSSAPYFYPLVNMGYTAATYFTAFMILERYVVVCRPFDHRHLCSLGRSYRISIGIILASIIVNIPRFFDYGAIPAINSNGDEIYEIAPMPLMTIRNYRKYYLFVTWFMTRFIVPFSVMVYSTIAISVEMFKSYMKREMLSTAKRHEHTLAKICVFIVMIFIICNAPTSFSRVARGFLRMKPRPDVLYTSNILLAINSSIKGVVLFIFKERYATHFFQLISLPCSFIIELRGWIKGKDKTGRSNRSSRTTLHYDPNEDEDAGNAYMTL